MKTPDVYYEHQAFSLAENYFKSININKNEKLQKNHTDRKRNADKLV